MRELRFGDRVFVEAETLRVLRGLNDGQVVFRHNDSSRYTRRDFNGTETWPGDPLPAEWERPMSASYDLEPKDEQTTVRLRRFMSSHPEVGIVLGCAAKQEGVIERGQSESSLVGPGRRITLVELAMPVEASRRKARIVLAYYRDLKLVG